eukprot:3481352-Rhodomonas_salina.3
MDMVRLALDTSPLPHLQPSVVPQLEVKVSQRRALLARVSFSRENTERMIVGMQATARRVATAVLCAAMAAMTTSPRSGSTVDCAACGSLRAAELHAPPLSR